MSRLHSEICLAVVFCTAGHAADSWTAYGGNAGGTRYSTLQQITRENVAKLKIVWTYRTGALQPETELNHKAAFEATPILIEGTLYLATPFNQVVALDPATGAARWTYDPKVDREKAYFYCCDVVNRASRFTTAKFTPARWTAA